MVFNKDKYWNILEQSSVVTIVTCAPRPGTDFLHSLLDYHDQIITFDGWLFFHDFYQKSISVNYTKRFSLGVNGVNYDKIKINNINAKNFFYEFAWNWLHKFDSRYDNLEKKGELGISGKEYNFINIDDFVSYAVELISNKPFSSRNALLAVYGAYALAKGEDLSKKKILLHCVHLIEKVESLANDFPDLKVIACMRDPRVLPSKVAVYRTFIPISSEKIWSFNSFLIKTLDNISELNTTDIDIRINVIENLHQNPIANMKKICQWLSIDYKDSMLESTWNGKAWKNDMLSIESHYKTFDVRRYEDSKRKWRDDAFFIETLVMCQLMNIELKYYYNQKFCSSFPLRLIMPLLILLPVKHEVECFKDIISKKSSYSLIFVLVKAVLFRYFISYKKIYASKVKTAVPF
jgi:hypothetical protein